MNNIQMDKVNAHISFTFLVRRFNAINEVTLNTLEDL